MLDHNAIERTAKRIAGLLPADFTELREEFENNARSAISALLEKGNLVTREEFDAQCALLASTREKLDRLEKLLTDLE